MQVDIPVLRRLWLLDCSVPLALLLGRLLALTGLTELSVCDPPAAAGSSASAAVLEQAGALTQVLKLRGCGLTEAPPLAPLQQLRVLDLGTKLARQMQRRRCMAAARAGPAHPGTDGPGGGGQCGGGSGCGGEAGRLGDLDVPGRTWESNAMHLGQLVGLVQGRPRGGIRL